LYTKGDGDQIKLANLILVRKWSHWVWLNVTSRLKSSTAPPDTSSLPWNRIKSGEATVFVGIKTPEAVPTAARAPSFACLHL
jgi:hypothetical protein